MRTWHDIDLARHHYHTGAFILLGQDSHSNIFVGNQTHTLKNHMNAETLKAMAHECLDHHTKGYTDVEQVYIWAMQDILKVQEVVSQIIVVILRSGLLID